MITIGKFLIFTLLIRVSTATNYITITQTPRLKNSWKRGRGPCRTISSSGSEGAVGGELAGGSVTERSLSSTTLTSVLSLAKGEADHATMHMDGHCKGPYGSQRG